MWNEFIFIEFMKEHYGEIFEILLDECFPVKSIFRLFMEIPSKQEEYLEFSKKIILNTVDTDK